MNYRLMPFINPWWMLSGKFKFRFLVLEAQDAEMQKYERGCILYLLSCNDCLIFKYVHLSRSFWRNFWNARSLKNTKPTYTKILKKLRGSCSTQYRQLHRPLNNVCVKGSSIFSEGQLSALPEPKWMARGSRAPNCSPPRVCRPPNR